jgi:archaemetzincin
MIHGFVVSGDIGNNKSVSGWNLHILREFFLRKLGNIKKRHSSLAPITFCTMLCLGALLAVSGANPTAASHKLYIQPLGGCFEKNQGTDHVVSALRAFYPMKVRVLDCQELSQSAYYAPRKRYRAERLLDYLNKSMPKDGWRILGLTDVDISTTKGKIFDWGVLGLGELPGTATVISSFRCRNKVRNVAHAMERLAKVAVHEIGHTLGLDHCPTVGCLMEDAMGKVATTDRERDFCARCRALAKRNGFSITEKPDAAWLRNQNP